MNAQCAPSSICTTLYATSTSASGGYRWRLTSFKDNKKWGKRNTGEAGARFKCTLYAAIFMQPFLCSQFESIFLWLELAMLK